MALFKMIRSLFRSAYSVFKGLFSRAGKAAAVEGAKGALTAAEGKALAGAVALALVAAGSAVSTVASAGASAAGSASEAAASAARSAQSSVSGLLGSVLPPDIASGLLGGASSPGAAGDGRSSAAAPAGSYKTSGSYTAHAWSYSKAPLYYTVRGKAVVAHEVKRGRIVFSPWDSRGRSQACYGKVTYSTVRRSAGWRADFTPDCDRISGWGRNRKVTVSLSNGRTYSGYAFNRSHLVADMLGATDPDPRNLVTGTRTQNVGNNDMRAKGGMQYAEYLAYDYIMAQHRKGNDSAWVYYCATPVYKGSELVPRSVYVDVLSDDGSVSQHVEVYNAMRGHKVDYATGKVSGR